MSRFKIIINRSNVQGVNNNFIYLFSQDASNIPSDFWNDVSDANGLDIHFYDILMGKKLSREIVYFDSSAQEIEAWIQIPFVSFRHDTEILCEYGGITASNDTSLWTDIETEGVYHCQDAFNDSSDGVTGVVSGASQITGGKINKCYDFYTTHDRVEVSKIMHTGGEYTVSAWAFMTGDAPVDERCIMVDKNNYTYYFAFSNRITVFSGDYGWGIGWFGGAGWKGAGSLDTHASQVNAWHKLVGTYDGTDFKIYRDGELKTTSSYSYSGAAGALCSVGYNTGALPMQWQGKIDELRIHSRVLDANWIKTEYNNQNSPETFSQCESFTDRKLARKFTITIDKDKTQGTNSNFIYLFSQDTSNIPDSLWLNVFDSDGLDIHFYDAITGLKLKREIVHFDATNQEIEAWIQIPTVSISSDTEIWCKYGETTSSNDTELWDDLNIKACYHMTATGSTGDILVDSTNNHNVIKIGAVLQTTGEIYKAQQFSLNNDAATGDHDDFDLMPDSAITFWCNPDLTGTQGYIAAKGSSGITGGWGINWRGDNDQIDFYHGGNTSESSSSVFNDTDWVYVAIKITGEGGQERVNFWRNGVTAGSANINDQVTNTTAFTLGNNYNDTGEATYFDGGIDEVRVYANYDLEVDRMVTEYNNQSDPATFSSCSEDSFDRGEEKTIALISG